MAFRGMQISTEQIAEMLQCKSVPVCLLLSLPPALLHNPSYTVGYTVPLSSAIKHPHTAALDCLCL